MCSKLGSNRPANKIIYSSPYIPAEWIEAHGFVPSRKMFLSVDCHAPINIDAGVCPYMRGFINQAVASSDAAAVILATTCDQMRRGSDFIRMYTQMPYFMMNIPSSSQTAGADRLYAQELKRLGKFLVSLGGVIPEDNYLAAIMSRHSKMRSAILDKRSILSDKRFSEEIAGFGEKCEVSPCADIKFTADRKIPIGLIGGSLMGAHFSLFDIFSEYGATVAIDATDTGERSFPASFDMRRISDDTFQVLAESYYGAIPGIFERPNNRIFMWMNKTIESRGVRGVVLVRHVWCDKWHSEAQRFRESIKVPLLDIELDDGAISGRTKNRIQAFMETL